MKGNNKVARALLQLTTLLLCVAALPQPTAATFVRGNIRTECPTMPDPLAPTVQLPHETDCSRYYICALGGQMIPAQCSGGMLFNPLTQACDFADNVECYVAAAPTTTPPPTTPPPTTPPPTTPPPTTPPPTTTTTQSTTESTTESIAPTTTTPQPTTTSTTVETTPPTNATIEPSTVTTPPTNATVEPPAAETTTPPTNATVEPTPPTNATAEPPTVPIPPTNATVEPPIAPPTNATAEPTDATTTENPTEEPTQAPTDAPTTSEPTEEPTDVPTAAPTTLEPTEPPTTENPTEPPTDAPTASVTPNDDDDDDFDEITPSPPTRPPSLCPEECQSSAVYLPVPGKPSYFVRCENGEEIIESCPEGLLFDPVLEACDSPSACPLTECRSPARYAPLSGSPHEFVKCVGGREVVAKCPAGLVFSGRIRQCSRG